jgi:hypothetical protein
MRPVTVTVGPLATASANNIATSQTPAAAGQLAINGSLASSSFTGTASISGNVMTVSAVSSGIVYVGMSINGAGVSASTIVTGVLTGTGGTGTYTVNNSQTFSSGTIYGAVVATLDTARRVLITTSGNESSRTFTITGTDANGNIQSEVVTGPNVANAYTNLDFKTVTAVVINGSASGAVTIGTNNIASSPWVRFDDYALSQAAIQCTLTNSATYTVQQTLQDPNSPTNSVNAYSVVWINSSDAAAVNATTSIQTSYQYSPAYAKVTLTAGAGSVTATFTQFGVAPY